MQRLKILDCEFMWHSQSEQSQHSTAPCARVTNWGLENISINIDYIELSVVFVCSGDVSSKHAVSPLSRSTLCARWPMFTPKIRFPARSLARPVRLIAAQQGPGAGQQLPGSVEEIPEISVTPGLSSTFHGAPQAGWCEGVTLSVQTSSLIFNAGGVFCVG